MSEVQTLTTLAEIYNKNLYQTSSIDALKYIGSRGITSEQIDKHLIGYSNSETSLTKIKTTKEIEKVLLKDGRDFFYNRIIFPIQYKGEVVNFTSRAFHNGHNKYMHMPGPIKHAYNQDVLSGGWVVIVEGPIDCLTLEKHGIPSIGLLGVYIMPKLTISELYDKDIYICFDSEPNQTGYKASHKLAKKFSMYGIKTKIVELPFSGEKTDVNIYFQNHTTEEFLRLLSVAKPYENKEKHVQRQYVKGDRDIIKVAEKYMQLRMSGDKFKTVCPFHDETQPSLVFYPSNTAFCFGCGRFITAEDIEKHFNGQVV